MSFTEAEIKAVLARIPREEKEMMLRLPTNEAMRIIELHHYFPGARRVDDLPLGDGEDVLLGRQIRVWVEEERSPTEKELRAP